MICSWWRSSSCALSHEYDLCFYIRRLWSNTASPVSI